MTDNQSLPQFSLAKDKIRVLLLEGVNDSAVRTDDGRRLFQHRRGCRRRSRATRCSEAIKGVHHARHPLAHADRPRRLLEAADRLIAIGCFSVGTNQVDVDAARRNGDSGLQRAVLQHAQRRRTGDRRDRHAAAPDRRAIQSPRMRAGWDKSATDSHEVRGKTLGIVGYGNIGSQLSYLAEAMGMRVVFYDHTDKLRHGNTEPTASLARTAGAERRRQHACAGNAGDAGHDRARRDRGDEARRLSHQQQPRHRRRSRRARRRPARRAGCAARRSTSFRSSRVRTRNDSHRRCRGSTTSS